MLFVERSIIAEFKPSILLLSFNWNGDAFELQLKEHKENYYTGKIIWNREPGGTVFFWKYNNGAEILLKGDFIEDDAGL